MKNFEKLKTTADEFFQKFWKEEKETPKWSEPWGFDGEILDREKPGCYALFEGENLVYVGVAIGRTEALGSRLSNYRRLNKNKVENPKKYAPHLGFQEITSIRTIAFEPSEKYLAAALEVFLIEKLQPPRNVLHSKKEQSKDF